MVGNTAQRLVKVVVGLVGSLLRGVGGLDDDIGGVLRKGAQVATFSGSSATVSATMSAAPASAFSGVSKPASSLTYVAAASSALPLAEPA